MDKSASKSLKENELLRPDHELPPPHDMLLEDGDDNRSPSLQKRNRSFPLWIFPLIALFFVLLAAGLYVKDGQKDTATESQTQAVKPTPTPIDAKKWSFYTNEDWRVMFQYPDDWKIRITSGAGELRLSLPRQRAEISAGQLNRENVENFINRRYRKELNRTISRRVLSTAPYKMTEYKIENDDPSPMNKSSSFKTIVIENSVDKFFFEQIGLEQDPIFDTIVRSFQFIEISGTPSPTVKKKR